MATEVNTSVAQEMNITHRRNDSFQLELSVTNASGTASFDLSQAQGGSTVDASGVMPIYQAKMTIRKNKSQHESLNLYTYYWKDKVGANLSPTLIQTGHYYGESQASIYSEGAGNKNYLYAGIYMLDSTSTSVDEKIYVKAPGNYMSLDPGNYVYDLQIRRKDEYTANNDAGAIYTTWLYGKFTIIEDITQV